MDDSLKILTNERRGRLKVVAFDRPPSSYSRRDFQTKQCSLQPVRGLELLSEPYFCHVKSIMFPNNDTASEHNEKIRELECHVVYSNIAIGSSPILQISLVIVRFMMVSLFLPSSQISRRMCNTVVSIN